MLPTTTWREVPKSAYASSTTCGGTPAICAYATASGMTNTHTVRPTIMSRPGQDRSYVGSLAQIGRYRMRRPPPVELVGVVICCIYACMRVRSAISY